jgi:1-hydroxycarotenoid 3,4-desaturase
MAGTADVVIVGGGIGGLAAAARLAAHGLDVRLFERHAWLGGKARNLAVGGQPVPAGPTVLTLKGVFDELFDAAGASLDAAVRLTPLPLLARHWWPDGTTLDLHADRAATRDAVADMAGRAAARAHDGFTAEAARIWQTLEGSFVTRPQTGPIGLSLRLADRPADLLALRAYSTLWSALCRHFADPRLVQLYARYATYCGTSPFAAPATLMLVAHVESLGVWEVDGGIAALAAAIADLAERHGGQLSGNAPVESILVEGGRAAGVRLSDGGQVRARAILFNGDPQALARGALGPGCARAVRPMAARARSLSALTWSALGRLSAPGAGPAHHNIIFSPDYRAEFEAIAAGRLPADPSVYVCAGGGDPAPLLAIVNAPPGDDGRHPSTEDEDRCETAMQISLRRGGLSLHAMPGGVRLGPQDQSSLWPSTGGALYGQASHGPLGAFHRPSSRSRLPGLYLAGGGTHPGPGVPMAAISGRLAAEALIADRTRRFHPRPTRADPGSTPASVPAAMPGGMSTHSATTAGTASS